MNGEREAERVRKASREGRFREGAREGGIDTFVLQGDYDLFEVVKGEVDVLPLHLRGVAGSLFAPTAAAAAALVTVRLEETFRA